jgi:hypothetical protein
MEITLLIGFAILGALNNIGWLTASRWRARCHHAQRRADEWFLKYQDSEERLAVGANPIHKAHCSYCDRTHDSRLACPEYAKQNAKINDVDWPEEFY